MTKIGKKIRENDYEIENKPYFNRLFWYYFQWTFYVVLKNGNWTFGERKKSGYFFEKGVDNGEKMWYNTRVKQSRALRSHLGTTVTLVNMVEISTIVGACRAETLSLYGFFVFGGVELLARKTKRHYSTSKSPQKRFV